MMEFKVSSSRVGVSQLWNSEFDTHNMELNNSIKTLEKLIKALGRPQLGVQS